MKSALRKLAGIMLLSWILFSYSDSHGQDTVRIPVWRAQMIAQQLIQFDSLMNEYNKILLDYKDMQAIASTRLAMINSLDAVISEKALQVEILDQKVMQAMKFEIVARKYKRQRNLVIAGVATLVVGGVLLR